MVRTRSTTSYTTKSSYPLKREPGGTSNESSVSSTLTHGVTLPRPRARMSLRSGVVPCSMPLGLISGRPFKPFSRVISSRNSDSSLLFRVLAQQLQHKLLKLRVRQARNLGWGGHNQPESNCPVSAQANSQPSPGLLPLLPVHLRQCKLRVREAAISDAFGEIPLMLPLIPDR